MKHENTTGSSRPALTIKTLISGVALSALLGLSLNVQAQTCVVSNWDAATGLADADAGTQDTAATNNRRYGGPCGLRVAVDGTERIVTDNSPSAESTYIARFYTFLDNAGSDPIIIYAADDGTEDQVQVWYNFPAAGDLTLRVFDATPASNDLTFNAVGAGWHSVEFVWEAAATADILFSVDGATDLSTSIDTSGITLAAAHLGNVNSATNGTSIDFDDFDSRRISRPGRLCRGLTDDSRSALALADVTNIFDEFASNGVTPAAGQPDFDENGAVDLTDALDVFDRFATGNEDCSLNS